jgi:ABC-type lipoprotein export system ATPase subunit
MKTDSQAIFVVGDTGSGKSTLINYLVGLPLTIKKYEFQDEYYIDNAAVESLPIGHQSKSKTKIPALISDSHGNVFIDTAGF